MDDLNHLNNMTVLQQETPKLDEDARGDHAVSINNPSQRDNPSLLNDTIHPVYSVPEHTSAKQDSVLTWSSINFDPAKSTNQYSEEIKGPVYTVADTPAHQVKFPPEAFHIEHHMEQSIVSEHKDVVVNHSEIHALAGESNPHHVPNSTTQEHYSSIPADTTMISSGVPGVLITPTPPVVPPTPEPPVVPSVPPVPPPPPVTPPVPTDDGHIDQKCDVPEDIKKEDISNWVRVVEHEDGSCTVQVHSPENNGNNGWTDCLEIDNKHSHDVYFNQEDHHIVNNVSHEDSTHIQISHIDEHKS
jgi:hypothetical protein